MTTRKRMTVALDSDLRAQLELESARSKRPMAAVVREALREYFIAAKSPPPPGAGAFASRHVDTAERHHEVLGELRFGRGLEDLLEQLDEKHGPVDAATTEEVRTEWPVGSQRIARRRRR